MNRTPENSPHSFLFHSEILADVKISIVIPVKDEEEHILKTLTAFTRQTDIEGNPFDTECFEILILANNCSDRSVELILDFQNQHPEIHMELAEVVLEDFQANIGYVRKILMETACSRLGQNGGGIMMTTDGDTTVAADWIARTQLEIQQGADAVGGRILLCPQELETLDEYTCLFHFKDEEYQLLAADLEAKILRSAHDPAPRHHQHFNGSFAVTTACYEKAGGSPEVAYLEDCAFFDQLQSIDAKVRHSHQVVVHTSARCIGRTEIGLSYQLNEWKNLGLGNSDFFVESAHSISDRLTIKRKLADLWKERHERSFNFYEEVRHIAPEFILHEEEEKRFYESEYFGAWYGAFVQLQTEYWQRRYPQTSIQEAVDDLKSIANTCFQENFSQTSMR